MTQGKSNSFDNDGRENIDDMPKIPFLEINRRFVEAIDTMARDAGNVASGRLCEQLGFPRTHYSSRKHNRIGKRGLPHVVIDALRRNHVNMDLFTAARVSNIRDFLPKEPIKMDRKPPRKQRLEQRIEALSADVAEIKQLLNTLLEDRAKKETDLTRT